MDSLEYVRNEIKKEKEDKFKMSQERYANSMKEVMLIINSSY